MAAEEANVNKREKGSRLALHVLAKPIGPACDISGAASSGSRPGGAKESKVTR